ncbi:fluoride efflux transporter CrcB [Pleionea mediterranea]|uniref:Fluoride-specific ion channel FluC n=1 Tax=Pleionea mediterranea TaxID=523701 RepID=A0A316FZY0_9GAMM|nr:fluoride efflux transporter CrcB [Pleionea mediterranea]PWK53266.1 camphor resistance protein CrcB [Pleionea mediterranea]
MSGQGIILLAVAIGSAAGGVLRYLVREWSVYWFSSSFPYGTLIVNVVGCLVAGCLLSYWQQTMVSPVAKAALMVGFLGALTTFSSFSVDTLLLIEQQKLLKALLNIALNMSLSLIAVFLGAWIGGRIGQA